MCLPLLLLLLLLLLLRRADSETDNAVLQGSG
jgi:hypothetical protein